LQRIYIEEGVRGWYRGLVPTLVGYLPTWAIYFTAYEHFKPFFRRQLGAGRALPWTPLFCARAT
jgi:solute carrier family 25 (mitochondrial folate transporter), member 32